MRNVKIFLTFGLTILFMSTSGLAQDADKPEMEKKPEQAKPAEAIQLKTVEPFFYCAIEAMGSFDQHGKVFGQLYSEAQTQGVVSNEAPFGVYWNSPSDTPVEKLKWEVGFPIAEKKDLKEPLKLKKWEFTAMVTAEYTGPFDSPEMGKLYGDLYSWIGKNQYTVFGPTMEKFLGMPAPDAQGKFSGHVQICIPVQKQAAK